MFNLFRRKNRSAKSAPIYKVLVIAKHDTTEKYTFTFYSQDAMRRKLCHYPWTEYYRFIEEVA